MGKKAKQSVKEGLEDLLGEAPGENELKVSTMLGLIPLNAF